MRKVLLAFAVLLALIIGGASYFFGSDAADPYQSYEWGKFSGSCDTETAPEDDFGKSFASCDYDVPSAEIPNFSAIDFPWNNTFDNTRSLPLMASALIDIDNDGVDEVFVSGGVTEADAIFKYTPGGFQNISSQVNLPAKPVGTTTLGATSVDLDNNGFNDLVLSGDYGVHWYKNDGAKFSLAVIDVTLDDKSNAATTTFGDIDNDGDLDMFLAAYIKLDKMEGQTIFKDLNYGSSSLLLLNQGNNTFEDVTTAYGLDYVHNTFQGVFVDIDKDNYLDLVVAYDTGEARTYKNEAGASFKTMPNPLTGKYAYPMGIAVGDYNNDGLVDFFFSNTGSSVPVFLARGDLAEEDIFNEKWILFRNDGDFKFTDVAAETKVANFEFSWGALFEDFNLDGYQDLVVAENYVDFPPHKLFKLPCRFLIQRPNGTFAAVEDQAGVVNKHYGITPLTSDFNQDGYPDLIYTNLNGPMKAYINAGGNANYLAVRFPETGAYVGTQVTLNHSNGKKQSDVYVIGEGLSSDQSSTLTFGLGTLAEVAELVIRYPGGQAVTIKNPAINQVHYLLQE